MQTTIADLIGEGRSAKVYCQALDRVERYKKPSQFVANLWTCYQSTRKNYNPSITGRVFEYALSEIFKRELIVPFYPQAGVRFIPFATYDFLFYDNQAPVVVSAKTSLRERWKQAAFEGRALQEIYPWAQSYLVTLDPQEAGTIQTKIDEREAPGLAACVVATTSEFDCLIDELNSRTFERAEPVSPITTTKVCF